MKIVSKHRMVFAVGLVAAVAALWGCKDFLEKASEPQGTLDETTLKTKSGVEGALIAAYRALDWTNGVGGNWGSAASNWVWASVPRADAYKGSEATDQPDINDVEAYHWSANSVSERYLNDKWRAVYEGVVRTNATLRLLKEVQTAKPTEISDADAKGITGEAIFLRAYYHFEEYRMGGNVPYYRELFQKQFRDDR